MQRGPRNIYMLRNNGEEKLTEFAMQAVVTTGALAEVTVQEWKADPAVMARVFVAGTR